MKAGPGLARAEARESETELAGHAAVCDASGALYLPGEDVLVVSDLHLEKGAAFARRLMPVPPYDTAATLSRLAAVIGRYAPRLVISLGDAFHDGDGARLMPDPFRAGLEAQMSGRQWIWIAGNHDPEHPAGFAGETMEEFRLGALVFRHVPRDGKAPGEIAGHVHPAVRVALRGQVVRRPCFVDDGNRMLMPAFGAYTGAVSLGRSGHARHFRWEETVFRLLGRDRIYAFPSRLVVG